jgi:hypothetical protein
MKTADGFSAAEVPGSSRDNRDNRRWPIVADGGWSAGGASQSIASRRGRGAGAAGSEAAHDRQILICFHEFPPSLTRSVHVEVN